jgi:nucleoid DNA-binding protein
MAKKCRFSWVFRLRRVEISRSTFLITPIRKDDAEQRNLVFPIETPQGGLHMAKAPAKKAPTKTEVFSAIAEKAELSKKQVAAVFDALVQEVEAAVGKKGPGAFTIPDLCKIVIQNKPATKKRQVRNPATGEMVWAAPKPARNVIKVRPLKKLKDMA